MSEYLGVQDGLDTSTPANLVNWIVHLSEKMGLLWARIICDQHPISKEIEDRFGVVHVEISIYTRLFLVAVARCKLMGSNVNSPYNQQALTLLNSTLALQQKRDELKVRDIVRGMSLQVGSHGHPQWQTVIMSQDAKIARDYALFGGCEIKPPAETDLSKHPYWRLAAFISETFYPPEQRDEIRNFLFMDSGRHLIDYLNHLFGDAVKSA